MTLEKLLQCSADQLDAFSEEQLNEWFKPLLIITRPELSVKPEKIIRKESIRREANSKKDKALEIMRNMGLNIKGW